MKNRFLFSLLLVAVMAGVGWLAGRLDFLWVVGIPVAGFILWKKTRGLLTTMEFSSVLISALALSTVVGTLFYGMAFFGQFWFMTIMGFLGVSSFLCLVDQIPKKRRVGFILIHASIVIVISGSTLRTFQKEDGMVHLTVGNATEWMTVMDSGRRVDREVRLPFTVRLDDFQVDFYEMVYVFVPGEPGPVASLNVERGREAEVAGAHIKVLGSRVIKDPPSEGHPQVERRVAIVEVDGDVGEIPADVPVGNERYALLYKHDSGEVKLYQSRVTLLDDEGNELVTQDIMVNHPLIYDGWWIYQSNWNAQNLSYSGLQAVRDPGLPLVLSGLAILVLGAFLKIRLPRRRREGAA